MSLKEIRIYRENKVYFFSLFFGIFCLGLSISVGCRLAPYRMIGKKRERPNILLITIDTLRADHLGCYGYERIKTPNIDGLAEKGVLFQNAFTPVPVTFPSHASIMTGTYPPFHGVRNNATFVLDGGSVTLAEILQDQGYQTAAVIGAYVLDERFGLNQGFDVYDDEIDPREEKIIQLYVERKAEIVSQTAIQWLSTKVEKPFFLWVHYFDPHAMYAPPLAFHMEYTDRPYDGEIAYTDQQIGELLHFLQSRGELEKTITVLTADHGESLGEHGEDTHAIFIYDATLHVPLIFHYPPAFPKPQRIIPQVRTIDIMPTILDLIDVKIPASVQGTTLCDEIFHPESASRRTLYCETHYPALNHGWSSLEGVRTPEWKYIQAPQPELYHLSEDAQESVNLILSHPAEVNKMQEEFDRLKKQAAFNGIQSSSAVALDAEARQKLVNLGYIRTSFNQSQSKPGPDPKEMIESLRHLNRAISYYTIREYEKAETELSIILNQNPQDIFARFSLGTVYMQEGDMKKALGEFENVASLDRNFMDVHNHLGACYEKLGQDEKALEEYNLAISFNPSFSEAYNNRGALYLKLNKPEPARKDFLQSIVLNATFPEAYNNLGISYEKEKRYSEAVTYFQKALKIRPNYPDAANNLGCAFIELGDFHEARHVLEEIVKSQPDHKDAHNNLGIIYNHLGNYDRAILELEETLLLDPHYVDAYVNLGIAYYELGEYDQAIHHYEKALKLAPDNPQAYINIGIVKALQGDPDQAVRAYQQAAAVAPESLDAHLNLAHFYREKGWTKKEIGEWETILLLAPENLDASIGLGLAYVARRQFEQAIPVWQRVIELAPEDARGYVSLADLYSKLGHSDKALENYQQALRLDDKNVEAHLGIGAFYYQQGNLDLAIQEWQRVISLDQHNTQAYFNKAAAFIQKGFFPEAIVAYKKVIELNQEDAEAHFYLALTYEQLGQFHLAVQEYQSALMIRPDYTQAYMKLQNLRGL